MLERRRPFIHGAVWLSIDDGWKEIYNTVIPEACARGIPVTLYLPSGIVAGDGMFWWSEAKRHKNLLYSASGLTPAALKQCREGKRKRLLANLKQSIPRPEAREALDPREARDVANCQGVTIGAHTISHPVLTNCLPEEVALEVAGSRAALETLTGKPVVSFAYPCGAWTDLAKEHVRMAGYRIAATTEAQFISADCDRFLLPRFCVSDHITFPEAVCSMTGVWRPLIDRLKPLVGRLLPE
jgi:peptidoglycan/xylan/chitin deacetylase (PgdA/CDA1 family)